MRPELSAIVDFKQYIKEMGKVRSIILISIKDTIGDNNIPEFYELMKNLGLGDLRNKMHWSMTFILSNNKIIKQDIAQKTIAFCEWKCKKHHFKLLSKGYNVGNYAAIMIDDVDYSVNKRGINIVVFDQNKNQVLDSVCFDLYSPTCDCYRNQPAKATTLDIKDSLYFVWLLEKKIDTLQTEIINLRKRVEILDAQNKMLIYAGFNVDKLNRSELMMDLYSKMPTPSDSLIKIQKAETCLLYEIDKICTKNDIRYWVYGGTLIGVIRHQGFIPWDDDIDIAMPVDDFNKFKSAIQSHPNIYLEQFYIFRSEYFKVMRVCFKNTV